MAELETLITTKGERLELMGNHPISLQEKETMYFLEKGSVNLFAIKKAEGPRVLIATLKGPILLFSMPTAADLPYEMVAITEEHSSLWKNSISSSGTGRIRPMTTRCNPSASSPV